jgi:diaminopimelate decarboxylase
VTTVAAGARPIPAPASLLRNAAERWGTPLYVTDLDAAAHFLAVYRARLPGALIAYAVKANPDPRLLGRLVRRGAGAEVVSGVELVLALRAGFEPERIVMNGVGKTDGELGAAFAAGILVNVESLDELDAALRLSAEQERPVRLGLRLNPGVDASTHPHLATGAVAAKFGIGLDELPAAFDRLATAGLRLAAIGCHIGSNIGSAEPWREVVRILARAEATAAEAGLPPERIDVGGGLESADPTLVNALAEIVLGAFPEPGRLILEPGRSVVAAAGWLVTRVVRTQPRPASGSGYLVCDAGMTELIRPILYGADQPVALVAPGAPFEPTGETHLAGPICEAGDTLVHRLEQWLPGEQLAESGPGALLALADAGAYGAAMASNYNGRLRPAEAVIDGATLKLSRRREMLEDLLARDAL